MTNTNKRYIFGETKQGVMFPQNKLEESEEFLGKYPIMKFVETQGEGLTYRDNALVSQEIFLLGEVEEKPKHIQFNLSNATESILGKMWKTDISGSVESQIEYLNSVTAATITGKMNEYPKGSGNFSLMVSSLGAITLDKDIRMLPAITDKEYLEDLRKELAFYLAEMEETHRKFALMMLDEVWDDFSIAPAAKGHHHNYLHGLLEHTVEVMRVAYGFMVAYEKNPSEMLKEVKRVIRTQQQLYLMTLDRKVSEGADKVFTVLADNENHYGEIYTKMASGIANGETLDKSLVLLATLFHDVGKIVEYKYAGEDTSWKYQTFLGIEVVEELVGKRTTIDMDEIGKNFGHITLGANFVTKWQLATSTLDTKDYLKVLGMIHTHHDKLEWGSIRRATTLNELVLHFSDMVDARFAAEV